MKSGSHFTSHDREAFGGLYSVPPKADTDAKDVSASKADDEEKPKPASERLKEAVRDSKVTVLQVLSAAYAQVAHDLTS